MSLETKEDLTAWQAATLADLVRHIVGTRHRECREDMAEVETLLSLLAMEPGEKHLSLVEIQNLVGHFCADLRGHLAREERDLFPVLLALEQNPAPGVDPSQLGLLGSLLAEDHVKEAGLLHDIRFLADALATDLPADSPQARLHAAVGNLAEHFEGHVQLEDKALFPRLR